MNHSVEEYPEKNECEQSVAMRPRERVSLRKVAEPVSLRFYIPYEGLDSDGDEVENEALKAGQSKDSCSDTGSTRLTRSSEFQSFDVVGYRHSAGNSR